MFFCPLSLLEFPRCMCFVTVWFYLGVTGAGHMELRLFLPVLASGKTPHVQHLHPLGVSLVFFINFFEVLDIDYFSCQSSKDECHSSMSVSGDSMVPHPRMPKRNREWTNHTGGRGRPPTHFPLQTSFTCLDPNAYISFHQVTQGAFSCPRA